MKVVTYPTARRHNTNRELNRVMNQFFNTKPATRPTQKTAATNVAETEDNFRLELAAIGWSKEDLKIELDKDTLTISAEKKEDSPKEGLQYLRREFKAMPFKRTFTLPETVDNQAIKANYKNGILTLVLPKKEEAKPVPPRKVAIA